VRGVEFVPWTRRGRRAARHGPRRRGGGQHQRRARRLVSHPAAGPVTGSRPRPVARVAQPSSTDASSAPGAAGGRARAGARSRQARIHGRGACARRSARGRGMPGRRHAERRRSRRGTGRRVPETGARRRDAHARWDEDCCQGRRRSAGGSRSAFAEAGRCLPSTVLRHATRAEAVTPPKQRLTVRRDAMQPRWPRAGPCRRPPRPRAGCRPR
jgi:hypothetical protein